jgi:1-acyl-sn-glycerol-3-phosphate acyltransferase
MNGDPIAAALQAEEAATRMLALVEAFVRETRPGRVERVSLDSVLDRDLGIDSLGRAELLLRAERAFGVALPERALNEAETPRDLLRFTLAAHAPVAEAARTVQRLALRKDEGVPSAARTLIEMIDWHVERHPDQLQIHLYGENDTAVDISYGELVAQASAVAAALTEYGIKPGQTVALMLPTCREYFFSFLGVLLAGAIPVPVYPPVRLAQLEDHMTRHAGILNNAQVSMLITVAEAKGVALLLRMQVRSLRHVLTPADFATGRRFDRRPSISADDIAFIQYTSGSTGNPKGVALTHANLLANLRAMGAAVNVRPDDVFVSWLPLYHDMGLIGAWFGGLYFGFPSVILSPLAFLTRPQRWLWAIHRHRGTLSAAPNFAFDLCVRRIADPALEGLDLSSWRYAFNGAEPVSADTITAFRDRFAKYGLKPETIAPVYGLAECSVGLAFPPPNRGPIIDVVQREAFTRRGRAIPAEAGDTNMLRFVACGVPLAGHPTRVVDAAGIELGERHEGRLQFKGPSATLGYYRNPEQTKTLFVGDWLDTGDYAYFADGDIYLTGRVKDLIIRGGRNIYPYDLEQAVGDIPGIRRGCVAVFGSPDPASGTERIVVLAETREIDAARRETLKSAVNDAALAVIGMPPDDIVLAPPHTVLKTSSGKIRRAASREFYESGASTPHPQPVWLQFVRLAWRAAWPQAQRRVRALWDALYGFYALACFGLMAPFTWSVVAVVGRPAFNRPFIAIMARIFTRLIGVAPRVTGLEHLPAGLCVLVMNHTSYLDGILLCAALPLQFPHVFAAKREFTTHWFPRWFLTGIGAAYVERTDPRLGVKGIDQFLQALRKGEIPVFFPEGTFDRLEGLKPFRSGAFAVAAQAGVAVVPVAIHGARMVYRDQAWLPRHGAVSLHFAPPVHPAGKSWNDIVRLRDDAREAIQRHCGEPDIG